jgi:transposase InsO family protein
LCEIIDIDKSSYYKWLKRDISKEHTLKEQMENIFFIYDKTCGYRRMYSELKDLNVKISEKKVREKMREYNLSCEVRRKKRSKKYQSSNEEKISFKNILNRKFTSLKPNQKYCTDMTQISTKKGDVFCSIIIDLFNREPVAYRSSYSCNTDLSIATLLELTTIRNISGSIFHSDQGITYTNKSFVNFLNSFKAQQSMSKSGCPYDNSPMENFFGTLKCEKIKRLKQQPEDKETLDNIIMEYLDFYINTRKNAVLGNLTPKQYYDKYNIN